MWGQRKETSLPGDLAHEKVTIKLRRISRFSADAAENRCAVCSGKYDGKYPGYVITANGYRVNIRWNECVEVKK